MSEKTATPQTAYTLPVAAPASGASVDFYHIDPRPAPRFVGLRRALLLLVAALGMLALFHTARPAGRFVRHACGASRARLNHTGQPLPSHFTLPSGDRIPSVALGVWQAAPGDVGPAVRAALDAGYRHIDGAWIYRNEQAVGQALRDSGVKREDVWVTSKLWNSFHAPEEVERAVDASLGALGVDYLDLYLMHWPVAFKGDAKTKDGKPVIDEALTADPYPTWQALEALVASGKVRNIGVSNFNVPRLQNLTANSLHIQPAVNQVELNFWNPQPQLLAYAKKHGLLLEAYSPLGSGTLVGETLRVKEVVDVAKELNITPAQAVISWHVQRGTVVLPKSVTPTRVRENLQITKLPEDAFEKIERAAMEHKPKRAVNPSEGWGLGYDVFEDYPYKQ